MKTADFPALLQRFFADRLVSQRQASPHTIRSYRDTFRLLLLFAQRQLQTAPSHLTLKQVDAPLIAAFLEDLESDRKISARSRNLRLTAIRSFFHYAAYEKPDHSAQIQRVLAIPAKRYSKSLVSFLNPTEIKALLAAPDQRTWYGRRDYTLMLFTVQTGLRLSEVTGAKHQDLHLEATAYIRCMGKGRKERCTPLSKPTVTALKKWLQEPVKGSAEYLFCTAHGGRLSSDAVQDLLAKYREIAGRVCPSLLKKRVTPHILRHTLAMELLQAGIDRSLIALWLGHESVKTTQIYLDADLALKEQILSKTTQHGGKRHLFKAEDPLLNYLQSL